MESKIKSIGKIPFHDVWVTVWYDEEYSKGRNIPNNFMCAWQVRNPDAFYQGYAYIDFSSGKVTYPDGRIPNIPTEEDKEMLPKQLIIYQPEITEDLIQEINKYLEKDYLRRNHKGGELIDS